MMPKPRLDKQQIAEEPTANHGRCPTFISSTLNCRNCARSDSKAAPHSLTDTWRTGTAKPITPSNSPSSGTDALNPWRSLKPSTNIRGLRNPARQRFAKLVAQRFGLGTIQRNNEVPHRTGTRELDEEHIRAMRQTAHMHRHTFHASHHATSNGARPRSTSALTCKSSASSFISFTLKAIRPVHFCETVDRAQCNVSATSACVRPLSPIRRLTFSPTVGESTKIFFTLTSNHECS